MFSSSSNDERERQRIIAVDERFGKLDDENRKRTGATRRHKKWTEYSTFFYAAASICQIFGTPQASLSRAVSPPVERRFIRSDRIRVVRTERVSYYRVASSGSSIPYHSQQTNLARCFESPDRRVVRYARRGTGNGFFTLR